MIDTDDTVTGTSSGFGRVTAEYVLDHGDIVVATLREPGMLDDLVKRYPEERLLVLKLDVTKSEEIVTAFEAVQYKFGRIDVVFNNAGFGVAGEVESIPEAVARAQLDTNFWGAVNVSKEAVRFFREINKPAGGRLINNSSICGLMAYPALAYYVASKFGKSNSLSVDDFADARR